MRLIRNVLAAAAALLLLLTLTQCGKTSGQALPAGNGILTPLTEAGRSGSGDSDSRELVDETAVLPLVNLGEDYNILALLDGNLDLEPSDEQVLLALPLDVPAEPLSLIIASTNPFSNQYTVAWRTQLSTRTLSGISMRLDDLTGNGRRDIVIAGFDGNGHHVTEVFAVPKNGAVADFRRVFGTAVDGNIDIITEDRSPGYYSGLSSGVPYRIAVQKKDPGSETGLDILETGWQWDVNAFRYQQGETRSIKGDRILEDRIGRVYAGDVSVYENYLEGAWYREAGTGTFVEMLYFDPKAREIIFFDGRVQEVFIWGESHRTTAKRLYTRVFNSVIPSLLDTISVSAESWDQLELARTGANWNGTFRRLGPSLQLLMDSQTSIAPILSPLALTGVWRSSGDTEIVFDLPGVEWIDQGVSRKGTASFFNIDEDRVLQIQFMKPNGALEETVNWKVDYTEDRDSARIIRSLALTPAELRVEGVRTTGSMWRRFEQIEVISPAE